MSESTKVRWEDDCTATLPGGMTVGETDGQGVRHDFTLAAMLDDEAVKYEDGGSAFEAVVAEAIREAAGRCRKLGILTAEAYLAGENG